LRRAIQKFVESPLSVELLSGKYKDGGTVIVGVDEKENKIVFEASAPSARKTKQKVEA
jgi:ATPases with chaperone activity, ATP-binding subunit